MTENDWLLKSVLIACVIVVFKLKNGNEYPMGKAGSVSSKVIDKGASFP